MVLPVEQEPFHWLFDPSCPLGLELDHQCLEIWDSNWEPSDTPSLATIHCLAHLFHMLYASDQITYADRPSSVSPGIGYATQIVIAYAAVSYIVIQAWAFFYLFSSFSAEIPWASCRNPWNTGRLPDSRNVTERYSISPERRFYWSAFT